MLQSPATRPAERAPLPRRAGPPSVQPPRARPPFTPCQICRRRRGQPVCLGEDVASLGDLCPRCLSRLRDLILAVVGCAGTLRGAGNLLRIFRALFTLGESHG